MIKVLLIEDEIPARKKLVRFLNDLEESVQIVGEIDTVANAIAFLKKTEVDLIFSDIELLDGQAFEIYSQVEIHCPIIFTTAYDQFWMNAFETNGIAYLLKPFSFERFEMAWQKFLKLRTTHDVAITLKLSELLQLKPSEVAFKKRFIIQTNTGMYFLDTENITLFLAEDGVVFAYDTAGKKHLLHETTLKTIETQLDPNAFYKINRGEIVAKRYLERIERYSKNSLSVKVLGYKEHVIVSQSNTPAFRIWLEK